MVRRFNGMVHGECQRCGAKFVKRANGTEYKYCSRECFITPVHERFMANLALDESGCVMWTGKKNDQGYGYLQHEKKNWSAHRMAWLIYKGTHPGEFEVCHSCDNPGCVREDHLFLGTHSDNMKDMVSKGRHVIPDSRGEKQGCSKLTDDAVRKIRQDRRSQSAIAEDYGVSQTNISMIKRRKTWTHVA